MIMTVAVILIEIFHVYFVLLPISTILLFDILIGLLLLFKLFCVCSIYVLVLLQREIINKLMGYPYIIIIYFR